MLRGKNKTFHLIFVYMSEEQVNLNFDFSNKELANFLENFAKKLKDGEIGLSFRGREELEIKPNKENSIDLKFSEEESEKEMKLEVTLSQDDFDYRENEEGRKKINVVVEE